MYTTLILLTRQIRKSAVFLILPLLFSSYLPFSWAANQVSVLALFQNKAMLKIDGKSRLLKAGQVSPEGVRLISANAREAVIEVNGRRDSYKLGQHVSVQFAQPESKEVRISRDTSGSFFTFGTINGQMVKMLVDTGATAIAMNEPTARRLGIPYWLKGEKSWVNTASGTAQAYSMILDRVQVGSILLRRIRGVVIKGNYPREVLLGMSFLKQVEMENQGNVLLLRSKF